MKRLWIVCGGVAVLGLAAIAVILILPKPPIPGPIKQELTSALLLPKDPRFTVDRQSVKYDHSLKLLTFDATAFGKQLVMSEQPTPGSFTDAPPAYQKILDTMNDYSDFDTAVGTVHLTRPETLHGKQAAVLNAKGTLLFVKPGSDLSSDQWRQIFKSFDVEP